MSALEVKRIGGGRKCCVPLCSNAGRFVFYLAGYPSTDGYGRELLCEKHKTEWLRLIADLAPSEALVLQLLGDLSGTVNERVDAIDKLGALGLAQEYRAFAVRETDAGLEPEEILDRILGVGELEAVA